MPLLRIVGRSSTEQSVGNFRATVSSIAICLALLSSGSTAFSQTENAAIARDLSYAIPAQDLNQAILLFAGRAGIRVFYDTASIAGLRSSAVNGSYTPQQAMTRLLAGTGISYRFTSGTSMSLVVPGADSTALKVQGTELNQIVVNTESAYGPVDGYIATQSATASKIDTPLAKVPSSVSVVSADQVEAQNAKSVVQALRYSSGVAAEVRGSATRYDMPYMRGFGAPGESILYTDGLPFLRAPSYATPQTDISSIERVELLKGPSSSVYGGTQAGGMVNVVTKRPQREQQNEVSLTYGSFNRKEAAFDFTGPVPQSDTLAYRMIGNFKDADTQVEYTEEQRLFLAPSLNWQPSDETELNVALSYTYDPEGGYYGVLPTVGTLWDNPGYPDIPEDFYEGAPDYDSFERKQLLLTTDLTHQLNDVWAFRAKANIIDLGVDTAAVSTSGLSGTTISRYVWDTQEDVVGGSFDSNMLGEFSTGAFDHTLLVGLSFQAIDWDYQAQFGAGPSIDYLDPDYSQAISSPNPYIDQHQKQKQLGLYVQEKVDFGPISLWGGLRYDYVDTTTRNRLTDTTSTVQDMAVSGKLGAVYSFDNGASVYGSWSSSFLPVTGTDAQTNLAFEPLTARQYEVGVKYEPSFMPGLFTVAVYDIKQDNTITRDQLNQSYQNGTTHSRGIEFEAKFQPLERWNVIAAVGLIDAELESGSGYAVGYSPVGTPDSTASFWTDYTFAEGILANLTVGGGVRYVGESTGGFLTDGTRIEVPGYTLVDAMAHYDLARVGSGWEGSSLNFNVSNLLDEEYVTCLNNNFCNYGNARTFSLKFTRKW
ncbi:TonB-dependent siderophore receptor [Labrenzia sp. CE80]|uniref:TonB-dependent siderophore receptor n=1 Tax=Labrenzia sp. CE80 TaxID=1788986 RepID=UPI00129B2A80|nr:TonB-dependent siderophore receptor [Labrenzia sp. CE80]